MLRLTDTPELLRHAVVIDSRSETNSSGQTRTSYVLASRAKVAGKELVARLVVEEDFNGQRFYNHEFSEIKNLAGRPISPRASQINDENAASERGTKDILQEIWNASPRQMRQHQIEEALWEHSQIKSPLAVKVQYRARKTSKVKVPREIIERIMLDKTQAKGLGFHPLEVETLESWWLDEKNDKKKVFVLERVFEGEAQTLPLSQLQAVHLTMMARQKADALAYHGYTAELLAEAEEQLTEQAKGIRA